MRELTIEMGCVLQLSWTEITEVRITVTAVLLPLSLNITESFRQLNKQCFFFFFRNLPNYVKETISKLSNSTVALLRNANRPNTSFFFFQMEVE